ncbi:hypothetical protein K9L67_00495 [Candidatus Woesearchaeota archaeon]|nr:hypothetical protein [Candidatus Woesearchaeota archaeon]MCF7900685.1 hypothetical protein [Candidatus Woesearchaeota archaeon]MCF8013207.1 hypothetical protein [Candidatus Woesearchaeota archaeon]
MKEKKYVKGITKTILLFLFLLLLLNSVNAYYWQSDKSMDDKELDACNSGVPTCEVQYKPPTTEGRVYESMVLSGICSDVGDKNGDGSVRKRCIPFKYMVDSFGMFFYKPETSLMKKAKADHGENIKFNPLLYANSPTNAQGYFVGGDADAYSTFLDPVYFPDYETNWMLNSITTPTGLSYDFRLATDTWKYSRGDIDNYYNFLDYNSNNYGGGARVAVTIRTDPLIGKLYERNVYDEGTLNVVPVKSAGYMDEEDLRKRSHRGTTYVSGSVLYGETETAFSLDDADYVSFGNIKNYFSTIASTPENTQGLIDFDVNDYNVGFLMDRYSKAIGVQDNNLKCCSATIGKFFVECDSMGPDSISGPDNIPFGSVVPKGTSCTKNFMYDEILKLKYSEYNYGKEQYSCAVNEDSQNPGHPFLDFNSMSVSSSSDQGYNPESESCANILIGVPNCPLNTNLKNNADCKCGVYRIFDSSELDTVQCVEHNILTGSVRELKETNPEKMGAAAGISRSWTRGVNYRTIIDTPFYDKDIRRDFDAIDAALIRMGNARVNSSYIFAYPKSFTGLSAGFLVPEKNTMITTMSDSSGEEIKNYVLFEDYNFYRGGFLTTKNRVLNYDNDLNLQESKIITETKNAINTQTNIKSDLKYDKEHVFGLHSKNKKSDDSGNIISENNFEYEKINNKYVLKSTASVKPDGSKINTNYEYDSQGRLIKTINSDGLIKNMEYDEWDKVIKIWYTDLSGNFVEGTPTKPSFQNIYDPITGFLKEVVSYRGDQSQSVSYVRDPSGRILEIYNKDTSENPVVKYFYYDTVPIKKITETLISENNYQQEIEFFSASGDVLQKQSKNADGFYTIVNYDYSILHGLINVSKPFIYDSFGSYVSDKNILNSVPKSIKYVYEDVIEGRLIKKVYPDGSFTEFKYSIEDGLPVVTSIAPNGVTKKVYYNLQSKPIHLVEKIGERVKLHSYFIYDTQNRLVKIIDPYGRTSSEATYDFWGIDEIDVLDKGTTDFVYDLDTGKVTKKIYPDHSANFDFDTLGNLKEAIYEGILND